MPTKITLIYAVPAAPDAFVASHDVQRTPVTLLDGIDRLARSRVSPKYDGTRPPACHMVDLSDCPAAAAAVNTPAAAITPAATTLLETVQSIGAARVTIRFSDLEP